MPDSTKPNVMSICAEIISLLEQQANPANVAGMARYTASAAPARWG